MNPRNLILKALRNQSQPNASDAVAAIKLILEFIGENPNRHGLKETPSRVLKSWHEIFGGYTQDPVAILSKEFERESYRGMIWLDNIEFYSTCEHHMQPFFGVAHVAYLPNRHVVGVSKLARLVEVFARRLQIQERMTQQIAETLSDVTGAKGVGVIVEAKHFCMVCRGVRKQNAVMRTSSLLGAFHKAAVRAEFISLIRRKEL